MKFKFFEINSNKVPIISQEKKDELTADEKKGRYTVTEEFAIDSIKDVNSAAIMIPLGVVVVDFDNKNHNEEQYIEWIKKEFNPPWVKTDRGTHFYFKLPKNLKPKRQVNTLCWVGLQYDFIVTKPLTKKKQNGVELKQKYSLVTVKLNGVERQRSGEFESFDPPELPRVLYPLQVATKRKQETSHIGLVGTMEGEREVVLNKHLFLIRQQYPTEEFRDVAHLINQFMLCPPFSDEEVDRAYDDIMKVEPEPNGIKLSGPRKNKGEFDIKYLDDYISNTLNTTLTFDVITKKYDWDNLTICKDHQVPTYILDQLRHSLKGVTKDMVRDFLDYIMFQNECNPILEKIESVVWDKEDRLSQLYEVLGVTDEFDKTLIKKWMWQSLTLLYNIPNSKTDQSIGADGCLVFQGKRGIGKTEFFKYLCSFAPKYFKMGAKLRFEMKDTLIEALGYWIVELGEVETTMKRTDVNDLKNFITCDEDEVRLPYGRGSRRTPRMTSFGATCNSTEFLRDDTGNRRFWVVQLNNNISRKDMYAIDVLQLWRQIFEQCEVAFSNSGFRLTYEERELLNTRTEAFQVPLKGEDTVRDILDSILRDERKSRCKFEFMTVTEWMEKVGAFKNLDSRQVGKVLDKLGFASKLIKENRKVGRLRYLPYTEIPLF